MKSEFYEYACPSKRITKKQIGAGKRCIKKEDLIGYSAIFFVLFVFSLPMALSRIWLWGMVLVAYIVLLVICKVDKDPYSKTLFFFGSTILYLCIVLSYLIVTEAYKKFQISFLFSYFVLTIFCVVFYEILVFVNILFKRYTARINNKKTFPAIYTTIGTFCGGTLGSLVAYKISPHLENSFWSVWLVLISCSLLFTISLSLFQKYILYKALYKKISEYRQQCN